MHDGGKHVMVKVFEETVKRPIRRKWNGYIKTTIMGNQKIIIKKINKVCNHGKAFTFHDDEGAYHGAIGKSFPAGLGKLRDRG